MFESLTGSFSSSALTNAGLALANSVYADFYKKWQVSITIGATTTVFTVSSSDKDNLFFSNNLAPADGTYKVEFANRTLLTSYESMLSAAVKIPDALLANKIKLTSEYFDKQVRSNFRNTYTQVSSDLDPMTLLTNLYEIQDAFCYYCLFLIFTDTQILKDDMSAYKSDKYYKQYQAMFKEGMSLIIFDENQDASIDNAEKSQSVGRGMLLER